MMKVCIDILIYTLVSQQPWKELSNLQLNDRFLMTGSDGMFFFWSGIMKDKKQNLECNQD